jgi:hypothetical protein
LSLADRTFETVHVVSFIDTSSDEIFWTQTHITGTTWSTVTSVDDITNSMEYGYWMGDG